MKIKVVFASLLFIIFISCSVNVKNKNPNNISKVKSFLKSKVNEYLKSNNNYLSADAALIIFKKFYEETNINGFQKKNNEDVALFQSEVSEAGKEEYLEIDFARRYPVRIIFVGEIYKQVHLTLYYDINQLKNKDYTYYLLYDSKINGNEWEYQIKKSLYYNVVKNLKPKDYKIYEDIAD
jgi:hypothetical protein